MVQTEFYSLEEVLQLLGVSERELAIAVAHGVIRAHRGEDGRVWFEKSEVDEINERRRVRPSSY